MALQLLIGNKNYSSWSMRPWVLMSQLDIPFTEVALRFDFEPGSEFRRAVARHSPAGRVPILVDDSLGPDFAIWDSLAIFERLHELHPDRGVWPADARERARARSICAEMHAGFANLRRHCPMNIEARLPEVGVRVWAEQAGLHEEVARLQTMWAGALATSGGPFLFGTFGAADAMYAPVCTRLLTYDLPITAETRAYVDRVLAAPGVARWIEAALAEQDYLDFEEPYRSSRG
jgi:glutathione S-transferase